MVLDRWVLTAAHCVVMARTKTATFRRSSPQEISILVGTNKLDGSGDLIPVEAIFRHPSYTGTSSTIDIALIKLARAPTGALQDGRGARRRIRRHPEPAGRHHHRHRLGPAEGGTPSPDLRAGQIQVLDREMCNTAMMEARAEDAAGASAMR
jgi:hypothetical protein